MPPLEKSPSGTNSLVEIIRRRRVGNRIAGRESEIDTREGKPLSFHSRTEISSAGNSWRASTVAASRSARINSHRRRFGRRVVHAWPYTRLYVCVRKRAHAHGGRRRVRCAWHTLSTLCGPHEREIKWNRGATLSRGPPRFPPFLPFLRPNRSRLHANLSTQFQIRSWHVRQGE